MKYFGVFGPPKSLITAFTPRDNIFLANLMQLGSGFTLQIPGGTIFIDPLIKMSSFAADISIFTVWFTKWFWFPKPDRPSMTTAWEVDILLKSSVKQQMST